MESWLLLLEGLTQLTAVVLCVVLCFYAYDQGKSGTSPKEFWEMFFKFSLAIGFALAIFCFVNRGDTITQWPRLIGALTGAALFLPLISSVCVIPWVIGRAQRRR